MYAPEQHTDSFRIYSEYNLPVLVLVNYLNVCIQILSTPTVDHSIDMFLN
jgi:hypothetical protein